MSADAGQLDSMLTGSSSATRVDSGHQTGKQALAKAQGGVTNPGKANDSELHGIKIRPLRSLDELTPLWLSIFLNRRIDADGFTTEPVGTGQMSSTYRVSFHEIDGPAETAVVKFASTDKDTFDLGIRFQHYLREAVFYRRFGDLLSAGLNRCFGAVVDEDGYFTMVLEDAGASDGYVTGQLEGADYEHAALALKSLARLQAPILGDPRLDDDEWLNAPGALDQNLFNDCLPIFLQRHPPNEEHKKLLYWMSENLDAWYATRIPPFAISHGDFRLDNIIFLEKDNRRAVAVDWGGSNWCSPLRDAAYFLGNGLKIEDRRKWEKELLRGYWEELNRLSKVKITWDHAWEEYRRQTIYGLAQHIPAAGILPDTERGKVMFRTLVSRQAQHAIDLNAMELVRPSPISYSPHLADECEHVTPVDADALWNESWYFDAVSRDSKVGVYGRVGLLPNQNCCTFMSGIFQAGRPPILLVDMHAPLPVSDPLTHQVESGKFLVQIQCLDPLKRFSLRLKGTGQAFDDPSAPLQDIAGTAVNGIDIQLIWTTNGLPYKRHTQTRYEIPCRVDGTIAIGTEQVDLEDAFGERNHSWGRRDWWSASWVWAGLHLSDGTHIFTIALGRGRASHGGSGFVQKDGRLVEVTSVVNEFGWREDGLPGNLTLVVEPGGLQVKCETIVCAGLRLLDSEGREAHLPRVMCRVRTSEDVEGMGWLDFNRVVKRDRVLTDFIT